MQHSKVPAQGDRARCCRSEDGARSDERERDREAKEVARQFVTRLKEMQPSDWLELGEVF